MKKFILTLLSIIILGCTAALAESHRIYGVIVFEGKGNPVFIQETSTTGTMGMNLKDNYLRDAEGKELKFNNLLPLVGYMQSIGWTVPDTEEQLYRNMANTINGRSTILVYKEVPEDEWLQWIDRGTIHKK